MDFVIEFNPDAFKHGVSEADIRRAFDTAVYDGLLDEADDEDARDKYLLIGFDCKANPLEILYNGISDYHVNVFHAMPCRSIYHHLCKIGEVTMARMTDEEAARLDEKWTENPPRPGPNGTGYFTQCKKAAHSITVDSFTANYLSSKAIAEHKTPAEIIGEMVQERIAASTSAPSTFFHW